VKSDLRNQIMDKIEHHLVWLNNVYAKFYSSNK